MNRSPSNLTSAGIRSALLIAAVGLVLYDWRTVWPRIYQYRQEYIDHADEPEVANPAKELFDRYQRESLTVLSIILFLLMGMILFSAVITPAAVTIGP